MSLTFTVLGVLAPIGAIDVVYYHLHRFRLFAREESVREEITHLVRQATFLVAAALLVAGVRTRAVDVALVVLFALDFFTSAADVLSENDSRASLGGLPRGEYLLHFLGTFGAGVLATTYGFERATLPIAPAPLWQALLLLPAGAALLLFELFLFIRARVAALPRRVARPGDAL
ncbi:MAG: hypothetical protein JST00_46745 [Deltaproteobacteria bacterium]|nr:hypothetical protein [Deltaproteobacteria bacterium]